MTSLGAGTYFGSSDDDEDETAELQRELEKIKRERAEKREQEVNTSFFNPSYLSYC